MESLVEVLTNVTNARETEGRVQLYRMQEQYEAKLEMIQVWGISYMLVLYAVIYGQLFFHRSECCWLRTVSLVKEVMIS